MQHNQYTKCGNLLPWAQYDHGFTYYYLKIISDGCAAHMRQETNQGKSYNL